MLQIYALVYVFVSKGAQSVLMAVYCSGCHGKHNCMWCGISYTTVRHFTSRPLQPAHLKHLYNKCCVHFKYTAVVVYFDDEVGVTFAI